MSCIIDVLMICQEQHLLQVIMDHDGWSDVRKRLCEWLGILGRIEWNAVRLHHASQNGVQFKICELFLEFLI